MAAHPNRSPSPISSDPNFRSFTRNIPFALTNTPTPSDSGRRSCLKNCEENENYVAKDQMLKASELQSPAKGSKSFMGPTVSSTSKFTPSPRKKTFVESNVSCSPPTAPLDADPSMAPYDPKTNYLSPRPQFRYYKPNPRIQILLSKQKETGPGVIMALEDDNDDIDSMSDNFSLESEGRQDSYKEKLEAIALADVVTGFEDHDLRLYDELYEKEKSEAVMSADMLEGFVFYDSIDVSRDSEKEKLEKVDSIADMVVMESEEASEEGSLNIDRKTEKKLWGASRIMCFSMVVMLMLMVTCVSVSVTRSPSLEEFGLIKGLSFSHLGQFYHRSRVAAANNAKVIWETCMSFVSMTTNGLGEGGITLVPLRYANLSDLQKGSWNDAVKGSDDDDDDELDSEMGKSEEEEYVDGVHDSDEGFVDGLDVEDGEVLEIDEIVPTDSSELDSEYREDNQCPEELGIEEIVPANSSESDFKYSEHTQSLKEIAPRSIITAPHDQESVFASENKAVPSENSDVSCDSDTALLEQEPGKGVQNSVIMSDDKFPVHYFVGFSFFLAALSAVAVFTYHYERIPSLRVDNKMNYKLNDKQKNQQEKTAFFSQNCQTEDDDDSSCTSGASSFLQNASRTKSNNSKEEMTVMRGGSEVHTSETKTGKCYSKRESLGSSSSEFTMGSPSYGSFTTLEKISVTNANGEDEIIKLVRRSSRIRSHHVTSL